MQKLIKTTEHGIMKFTTLDAVSGNTLAGMLEVKHDKMMRTIKRVMKYEANRKKISANLHTSHTPHVGSEIVHIVEENELNFNAVFKEWEYLNERGRKYKTFIMNEDALYLVIANTQSAKAHELKVWFKSEFNKMREEREEREHIKQPTKARNDRLKDLSEALTISDPSSKRGALMYTHVSQKINIAIFGTRQHDRNTATKEELLRIGDMEHFTEFMTGFSLNKYDSPEEARERVFFSLKQDYSLIEAV